MDRRVTTDFPSVMNLAAADDDISSERYFDDGCDADHNPQDIAEEEISVTPSTAEEDAINEGDDGTAATEDDEITVTSASSSETCTNVVTQRRVHFDETVAIGSIPLLEEYTPAELEAMYYSHVEEDNLRAEAKYVVKSIRMARMQEATGHPTAAFTRILEDDNDDYCPRGLENYLRTREEKRVRKAEAKDVIYSVLLAQEEQWETIHGAHDDHREEAHNILAVASATRSRRSRATAIEMAVQDQEEVRQMIKMEEKERREREQQQKEAEQLQQEKALPTETTDTTNKPTRGKAARRMSAAASNIASKVVRKASSSIIPNSTTRRRKTAAAAMVATATSAGNGKAIHGSPRAACA